MKNNAISLSEIVIKKLDIVKNEYAYLTESNYSLVNSKNKTINYTLILQSHEFFNEFSIMSKKFAEFGKLLYDLDNLSLIFSISNIVSLCFFSGVGIIAYIFKRKNFLLAISYIIFFNIIATYLIIFLKCSYLLYSIDICPFLFEN